jgi:hypothetical protein
MENTGGRTNFRQEQIKQEIEVLEKQISEVKQVIDFDPLQVLNGDPNGEQAKLESLQMQKEELSRKLRSLQLNQIRQRNRRERKRKRQNSSEAEDPVEQSSVGKDIAGVSFSDTSSQSLSPVAALHQLRQPVVIQSSKTSSTFDASHFTTTSSTTSQLFQNVSGIMAPTTFQQQPFIRGVLSAVQVPKINPPTPSPPIPVFTNPSNVSSSSFPQVSSNEQHPASSSNAIPASPNVAVLFKPKLETNSNTAADQGGVLNTKWLQQIISMSELEFLDLLQSFMKATLDLRGSAMKLVELRQQYLRDCSAYGQSAAQAFFYVQVERGWTLTKEQKQNILDGLKSTI